MRNLYEEEEEEKNGPMTNYQDDFTKTPETKPFKMHVTRRSTSSLPAKKYCRECHEPLFSPGRSPHNSNSNSNSNNCNQNNKPQTCTKKLSFAGTIIKTNTSPVRETVALIESKQYKQLICEGVGGSLLDNEGTLNVFDDVEEDHPVAPYFAPTPVKSRKRVLASEVSHLDSIYFFCHETMRLHKAVDTLTKERDQAVMQRDRLQKELTAWQQESITINGGNAYQSGIALVEELSFWRYF